MITPVQFSAILVFLTYDFTRSMFTASRVFTYVFTHFDVQQHNPFRYCHGCCDNIFNVFRLSTENFFSIVLPYRKQPQCSGFKFTWNIFFPAQNALFCLQVIFFNLQ